MIRLDNVEKSYGKFSLKLSLEIPDGRVTGLIGRNGAGKSTLLDMIMGLIKPDKGTVTLWGKDSRELTGRDRAWIASVRQDPWNRADLTLEEWSDLKKIIYSDYDETAFRDGCMALKLPLDLKLKKLSPGQRAAGKMMGALAGSAKLLILDEPTVGLDAAAREYLLDRLRNYLALHEEAGVIISSHISSDLEGLCDDLILLDKGRIRLKLETDELKERYAVLRLPEEKFAALDKSHILGMRNEHGIAVCLTDERSFYEEQLPGIVAEPCGIDSLILLEEEV